MTRVLCAECAEEKCRRSFSYACFVRAYHRAAADAGYRRTDGGHRAIKILRIPLLTVPQPSRGTSVLYAPSWALDYFEVSSLPFSKTSLSAPRYSVTKHVVAAARADARFSLEPPVELAERLDTLNAMAALRGFTTPHTRYGFVVTPLPEDASAPEEKSA